MVSTVVSVQYSSRSSLYHTLCSIGMGYDANTVVASYSSLDSQCMSFASSAFLQKKSDSVNKYTMFDIIKVSNNFIYLCLFLSGFASRSLTSKFFCNSRQVFKSTAPFH